jgi:uncharacterized protein
MKPRINIITLGVHDLKIMREFYERLGLTASAASQEKITFFNVNGVVLGLYGYEALAEDVGIAADRPQNYRGVTLAWNATSEIDVDAIIAHAVKVGATVVKAPHKVFWGGYSGYFADPEGNLWEVAFNPFAPLDENMRLSI